MRVVRRFVWSDDRPDEYAEILSPTVERLVMHGATPFHLRRWDIRYGPGKPRVTEAVYEEAIYGEARATGSV